MTPRKPKEQPKPNRSARVMIAISPQAHNKLKKLAKRNQRTQRAQLELLITAEVLY